MPLHLTPELEARIDSMVALGDYPDPVAVIADALRLLELRAHRQRLAELLAVGEAQEQRGEVIEYTPDVHARTRDAARRRAQAGETPSPDVCP